MQNQHCNQERDTVRNENCGGLKRVGRLHGAGLNPVPDVTIIAPLRSSICSTTVEFSLGNADRVSTHLARFVKVKM
jgi:hypothetical protein